MGLSNLTSATFYSGDGVRALIGKSSISYFRSIETDVDAFREHYSKTLKPVEITPFSGSRVISVEDTHFSIGDFDIWGGACRSGMNVSFSEPPEMFTIYLPLEGSMEMELLSGRFASIPGTMIACDLARAKVLSMHEGRRHIGLAFSKASVIRQLSQLIEAPVVHDLEMSTEIGTHTGPGRKIAAMIAFIWRELTANPEVSVQARSTDFYLCAILSLLLESVPHRYSNRLLTGNHYASPRQLRRAISFMMEHIAEPLSIDRIAADAGISKRALQLAFQQFRGTTPSSYLRSLRLEGVRNELLAGNTDKETVSAVAQSWGFSHMGWFAAAYREAFGELPSVSFQLAKTGRK